MASLKVSGSSGLSTSVVSGLRVIVSGASEGRRHEEFFTGRARSGRVYERVPAPL
jgi:hypothetical protein